jgi:peptide/nickel transport system permease protein
LHIIWNKLSKNKSAVAGLIVAIMLVFIAVFAGLIVNYEKEVINQNISNRFQTYSKEHILGTDMFGRDLLARIIYGARLSMYIGTVSVLFSALFGVMLGSVSAYYGGKTDNIIMRVMDILQSLPQVMLALTIVAALGQSNENIIMAISISGIPAFTRIIRSSIISVRNMEYIEAAHSYACSDFRIILKHILPNSIGPLIVQSTMSIGRNIMNVAGLSFVGLGVRPPLPEWGAMLSEARQYMRYYPHIVIWPGIAIVVTVLAFNLLGDGLRDALDPRLRN